MKKLNKFRPYLDYIVFGALLCSTPLLVQIGVLRFAWLTIIAGFVIYSIVSLGMNLLMGYGGLVSLGTAGFMGLAAYLTSIFTMDFGLPFLASFVLTVAITMLLGLVVGLVSLRVHGFFLAIATLVISEILRQLFIELSDITGGFTGRRAQFPEIFGMRLDRNTTFVLLVVFLVVAMIITHNIFKSYTGRAMSAMRDSESAAAAMGVNIFRYRLVCFALATGFAGAGGVLYMHFMHFAFPNTWTLILSLFFFAVVVIGGVRSVAGTILGSFIVFGLPDLVLVNVPIIGDIPGMAFVFTGVVIILVVLFYPAGLIYIWQDIRKLIRKGGKKA
jgi:branched-chain amino acid transport system permease protein